MGLSLKKTVDNEFDMNTIQEGLKQLTQGDHNPDRTKTYSEITGNGKNSPENSGNSPEKLKQELEDEFEQSQKELIDSVAKDQNVRINWTVEKDERGNPKITNLKIDGDCDEAKAQGIYQKLDDRKYGIAQQSSPDNPQVINELLNEQYATINAIMSDLNEKYDGRAEMPPLVARERYDTLVHKLYEEVQKNGLLLSPADLLGILRTHDSNGIRINEQLQEVMKKGLTEPQINKTTSVLQDINTNQRYKECQDRKNVQVTSLKISEDGYTITMYLKWRGNEKPFPIEIPNIIKGYQDLEEYFSSQEHPENDSNNNTDNAS